VIEVVAVPPALPTHERALRNLMARDVGVQRDAHGLERALGAIARLERETPSPAVRNLAITALLIAAAAYARRERRAALAPGFAPAPDPAQARRSMLTLAEAHAIAQSAGEAAPIALAATP
jgi:L-aspartate oxidase